MDRMQNLFDMIIGWLASSDETLGSALAILAFTTAIAVVGQVISHLWTFGVGLWDAQRIRREILTDIAIYARTYDINVKVVTSEQALTRLRKHIEADPEGFRGYGAAINDSDVYEEYKRIRRSLSPKDMSRCDTFFGDARLFELYYRKLAEEEFGRLPKERKLLVVQQLNLLGVKLEASNAKVRKEVKPISKISKRIKLEDLLPEPTSKKNAASKPETEQRGSSDDRR